MSSNNKMYRYVKKLLLLTAGMILLAVFFPLLVLAVLSYSGYCFEDRRFFVDEEITYAAILDTLKKYPISVRPQTDKAADGSRYVVDDRGSQVPTVPYENPSDFSIKNPECCQIVENGREGFAPTTEQRLFGGFKNVVMVKYRINFTDASGSLASDVATRYVGVSNCGKVRCRLPSLWGE